MSRRGRRSPREQAARSRAMQAVGDLRGGRARSLSEAARRRGTTTRTVHRYMPSAITKPAGSRQWRARAGDTYGQVMEVCTVDGVRIMFVRGSRQRATVGQHWRAIGEYKEHADESGLAEFTGVSISGVIVEPGAPDDGRGLEADLLTDLDDLDVMAGRGELDEIDVYALAGSR